MFLASNPRQDVAFAAPRMQMTSVIIRDLGSLGDADLARVRGYVDGLREARDRAATAVSPVAPLPLIRNPDEPFGPLHTWPVPEWIKVAPAHIAPGADLSRRVRQNRHEAEVDRSDWRKWQRMTAYKRPCWIQVDFLRFVAILCHPPPRYPDGTGQSIVTPSHPPLCRCDGAIDHQAWRNACAAPSSRSRCRSKIWELRKDSRRLTGFS